MGSEGCLKVIITSGTSYCWQVALQQSLLPLQIYASILIIFFDKLTNYFWPHYRISTNICLPQVGFAALLRHIGIKSAEHRTF